MPLDARKNLVYHFGESDEDETEEAIKVFLRLKPSEDSSENILEILNSKMLIAKVPKSVIDKKKSLKHHDSCKYTFSHIFGPMVSQKEIFSKCVEKSVQDFLTGNNCLLFSYGTTNAGKTFTVQGNANQPGIIPRSIAMIFKSIGNKLNNDSKYCPLTTSSVIQLNKKLSDELMELKNKIIYWDPEKCQNGSVKSDHSVKSKSTFSSVDFVEDLTYKEMESKLDTEITGTCFTEENVKFSVWVSFVEIYNEGIYDLLQPPNEKGKRPQLKLIQDAFKNSFIKGLKHINVNSAAEAYKVLTYGRNNLCFATTGMNRSSSRSHCIFSIKLSRFIDVNNPDCLQISSFSICDLAGAERQKSALNVGDRLKESQSINCSLHVLSRCFNIIRENQTRTEKQRIPFRDSKLTQLFQHALSGKESITMIINVNPSAQLYEETQQVLKASAIARHIVFQANPKTKSSQRRMSRFSQIISEHKKNSLIPWDSSVKPENRNTTNGLSDVQEEVETPVNENQVQEEMEYLLSFVEKLQDKLRAERQKTKELKQKNLTLEADLRKELTGQFAKIIQMTRDQYDECIKDMEKSQAKYEKQKIALVKQRYEEELQKMKQKLDMVNNAGIPNNIDSGENEELKEQLQDLEKQVDGLTKLVNITKEENSELAQKVSYLNIQHSVVSTENERLKKALEATKSEGNESLMLELESLRKEMDEKINLRNEYLKEAQDDLEFEIKEKNLLEEEVDKLERELAVKEQKVDDLESDLKALNDLLTLKIDINDSLETKLQSITENYDELKREYKDRMATLMDLCKQKEENLIEVELEMKKLGEILKAKESVTNNLQIEFSVQIEEYKKLQAEHAALLEKKCENCEKIHLIHEEQLSERNKEITLLQKEIKELLQQISSFKKDLSEKCNETELLQKKLKESVYAVEKEQGLENQMKEKNQEIESLRSQLIAYEHTASIMKSYSEEMTKKDTELSMLRQQTKEQAIVIQTLEQELQTFQSNQKLICARYDEQLRKCKEEVDREKREAASLSNTLYKSTPTPKKDLQAENDRLKKELEAERLSKNSLLEEISVLKVRETVAEVEIRESFKENKDPNKHQKPKTKTKSVPYFTEVVCSARKTRGQRQKLFPEGKETINKNVTYPETSTVQDVSKETTQKRGKSKRRLYNPSQDNAEELGSSFEIVPYTGQESPGSAIKHNLRCRNRNK